MTTFEKLCEAIRTIYSHQTTRLNDEPVFALSALIAFTVVLVLAAVLSLVVWLVGHAVRLALIGVFGLTFLILAAIAALFTNSQASSTRCITTPG